jgi:hypothetical protein
LVVWSIINADSSFILLKKNISKILILNGAEDLQAKLPIVKPYVYQTDKRCIDHFCMYPCRRTASKRTWKFGRVPHSRSVEDDAVQFREHKFFVHLVRIGIHRRAAIDGPAKERRPYHAGGIRIWIQMQLWRLAEGIDRHRPTDFAFSIHIINIIQFFATDNHCLNDTKSLHILIQLCATFIEPTLM